MINVPFDPKLAWNCWIMLNYAGAMTWWAYHGSRADVWYWASALSITACVTFGYQRA